MNITSWLGEDGATGQSSSGVASFSSNRIDDGGDVVVGVVSRTSGSLFVRLSSLFSGLWKAVALVAAIAAWIDPAATIEPGRAQDVKGKSCRCRPPTIYDINDANFRYAVAEQLSQALVI